MEVNDVSFQITVTMITDLMNYHRKLTNAPKEFWQTDEESAETLRGWLSKGMVLNIYHNGEIVGFFYVRFGGQDVAWLEDLFVLEQFRGQGIAKASLLQLDKLMQDKGVRAMFVDVIPRNLEALSLYTQSGFDHLNMIQLRKNYDQRLNKSDEIDILGFRLKKY